MKIIKFQNKVNDYQYFINETELVNHLKNVVFKNEPNALINTSTGKELSNDYLINESFDIGESEYVNADLEYIEDRDSEAEKWLEKKTGKMLIVPIEIISGIPWFARGLSAERRQRLREHLGGTGQQRAISVGSGRLTIRNANDDTKR